MWKLLLAVVTLLLAGAPAAAQWQPVPAPPTVPRSSASATEDVQSGQKSDPSRSGDASTSRGESATDTDTESSTIRSGNTQRGVDSQGNVWNYDRRSGTGWNSRGRPCVASGGAAGCY